MSDSATPWTVALQAPLSMRFSKQEYWSGLPFPSPGAPFPSPGDLPDLGIKPESPALQADSLSTEPPGKPIVTKQAPELSTTKMFFSTVHCIQHTFLQAAGHHRLRLMEAAPFGMLLFTPEEKG